MSRAETAVNLLLSTALSHHQAGRIPQAYDLYRKILDVRPGHPDALHLLGVIAHQLSRPREAVDLIRMAVAVRGDNPDYLVNLGNALQADGRVDEAIDTFRQALSLEPDRAETLFNLGNALMAKADWPAAAHAFQQATAAKADFSEAHLNRGLALRAAGEVAGAEEAFRAAVAVRNDHGAALYNLGLVLGELGRPGEAAGVLAHAARVSPSDAIIHDALGSALKDVGKLEDAVAAHRCAVEIDPDRGDLIYNLGAALQDLGRRDEAMLCYRRCLAADPDNASARHMAAALSGETTPVAPEAYVRDMFDGYAPGFEHHLVEVLEYRAPAQLRAALDSLDPEGTRRFDRALDLGCGTGLVGRAVRDRVAVLHGVDLAPRMVAEARESGAYDAVFEGEIRAFLAGAAGAATYDLILAADLFIYIGDLAPVFAALARRLAPGGLLAFSVETLEAGTYALRPSGRYAQSASYIDGLAADHGLDAVLRQDVVLRKAADAPVPGRVHLLARPVNPATSAADAPPC